MGGAGRPLSATLLVELESKAPSLSLSVFDGNEFILATLTRPGSLSVGVLGVCCSPDVALSILNNQEQISPSFIRSKSMSSRGLKLTFVVVLKGVQEPSKAGLGWIDSRGLACVITMIDVLFALSAIYQTTQQNTRGDDYEQTMIST